MAQAERGAAPGPGPLAAPASACPRCGKGNAPARRYCAGCETPLPRDAELELEARKWSRKLLITAATISLFGCAASLVLISSARGTQALSLATLIGGGMTAGVSFWGFRRRTPALLLIATQMCLNALIVAAALIVESTASLKAFVAGFIAGAAVLPSLFAIGLIKSARAEGSLREVGTILGSILAFVILTIVVAVIGKESPNALARGAVGVSVLCTFLAWWMLPTVTLGLHRMGSPAFLGAAAALAILLGWAAQHYGSFVVHAFGPALLEKMNPFNRASLPDKLLSIVVAAPLAEEVLFRGAIQQTLKGLWGLSTAVLGTALLFTVAHANPVGFPLILTVGLALGLLREYSGSLVPCIVFHALYNATVVLV